MSMNQSTMNPTDIPICKKTSTLPLIFAHVNTYANDANKKAVVKNALSETAKTITATNVAIAMGIIHFTTVRFTVHTPIDTEPMTNGIIFWNSIIRFTMEELVEELVEESIGVYIFNLFRMRRIYYV